MINYIEEEDILKSCYAGEEYKFVNEILIYGGFTRDINDKKINLKEFTYLKKVLSRAIQKSLTKKGFRNLNLEQQKKLIELYSIIFSKEIEFDNLLNTQDLQKIEEFINLKLTSDFDFSIKNFKIFFNKNFKIKYKLKKYLKFSIIIPINKYHIFNDEENQKRNSFSSISLLISKMRDVIVNLINNNYNSLSLCKINMLI